MPPFSFKYAGPAIVAGNAACLFNDLKEAYALSPGAPVMAVNGAAAEVKALWLYSMHPERLGKWTRMQHRRFHSVFSVHSNQEHTFVDYAWPGANGPGGSAWGARKVLGWMGFDPVILCGCPLDPGPYTNGGNIGGYMHKQAVVDKLLSGLEKDCAWHAGALSLSGRTRAILGAPDADLCLRPAAGD